MLITPCVIGSLNFKRVGDKHPYTIRQRKGVEYKDSVDLGADCLISLVSNLLFVSYFEEFEECFILLD